MGQSTISMAIFHGYVVQVPGPHSAARTSTGTSHLRHSAASLEGWPKNAEKWWVEMDFVSNLMGDLTNSTSLSDV